MPEERCRIRFNDYALGKVKEWRHVLSHRMLRREVHSFATTLADDFRLAQLSIVRLLYGVVILLLSPGSTLFSHFQLYNNPIDCYYLEILDCLK